MTVLSEGLLVNSNYIKMGRERGGGVGGFQAFVTQPLLVIVCHAVSRLSIYGFETVNKKSLGARRFGL